MQGIPPVTNTDDEDVAWGLQTAEALWKRGEHIDALVWLRRAAQAAGDASDDDRALELARAAAELSDWLADPSNAAAQAPAAAADTFSTDEARTSNDALLTVEEGRVALPPNAPTGPGAVPASALRSNTLPASDLTGAPAVDDAVDVAVDLASLPPDHEPSVLPADQVHAGMFNPWEEPSRASTSTPAVPHVAPTHVEASQGESIAEADDATPPDGVDIEDLADAADVQLLSDRPPPPGPTLASSFSTEDEVITSVRNNPLSQPALPQEPPPAPPQSASASLPVAPPKPPRPKPPPPSSASLPAVGAPRPPAPKPAPPPAPRRPPSVPASKAASPAVPPPAPSSSEAVLPPKPPPPPRPAPAAPEPSADEARGGTDPAPAPAMTSVPPAPDVTSEPAQEAAPEVPAELPHAAPPAPAASTEVSAAPPLDLEAVEAFADLPDDARVAFAAAARLDDLAEGEEVQKFALAFVLSGSFDVAATMVDAPAVRVETGAVLRARGTRGEGVPMRLICASESGKLATWSDASVEVAFRSIPWVEDDLRAAADRVQTLVGITVGPLGERLDASIRAEIVSRLTMRPFAPGELVVEAGAPVPGLLLVGVGELELADRGTVGAGEFLFPGEVLGAGTAPATVRAGALGALVLFGDRGLAQELLVTCPPLLEVFAGM